MKKLYLILVILIFSFSISVLGEEEESKFLLSENTYKILNTVNEQMVKEDYQNALDTLNKLIPTISNKVYDLAIAFQTQGFIYNAQENYSAALNSFLKAMEKNALPEEVSHNLNYIIAQLMFQKEAYHDGLEYLVRWLDREDNPGVEAHILAASAYYQTGEFNKMITHANDAIKKSTSPQKAWYELLLSGYYETKNYAAAAKLLEEMIARFPDTDSYWLQLATVYQHLKQDKKALSVSELAYKKNLLDEQGILQLVQTYLYLNMPYDAARLLSTELENGKIEDSKENIELLFNSWLMAKETEQAADFLSQYIDKLNDPSLYYRLGHIYVQMEDWNNAILALESAIADQQFKEVANTWLLLGIASYRNGNNKRSAQSFKQALNYNETKEQAEWWLDRLNNDLSESES